MLYIRLDEDKSTFKKNICDDLTVNNFIYGC